MTRLNAALRRDALRCLKGRWGKAVAGTIFLVGVATVILLAEQFCLTAAGLLGASELQVPFFSVTITPVQGWVSLGTLLLAFLTMVPLTMGIQKWFYHLAGGPTPDLRMIFDYLSSLRLFCKALALWLAAAVRTLLCGAVMSLLPILLWLAQKTVGGIGSPAAAAGQAMLFFLFVIVAALAAVLTFCFSLRYFLAPYYLAEDDRLPVRQAIRRSVRAMKGMHGQVFTLILSWLPLLISCMVLLPIVFSVPFCGAALAINARYLMSREIRRASVEEQTAGADRVSCADTIVF